MNETQVSIPETKLTTDSVKGSEVGLFKDTLAALRNEVPADILKELATNKTANELLNKSGDTGNVQVESISQVKSEVELRLEINEKSPYSEEVNNSIRSVKELNFYIEAGLKEVVIGDRSVLVNPNIDMNKIDDMGQTNMERMMKGRASIDSNGESYNLHHIGQKSDSPLAEITNKDHKENDAILHDKLKPTEVHDNNNWNQERSEHWKSRASLEYKGV